jgi:hypothetical protein
VLLRISLLCRDLRDKLVMHESYMSRAKTYFRVCIASIIEAVFALGKIIAFLLVLLPCVGISSKAVSPANPTTR